MLAALLVAGRAMEALQQLLLLEPLEVVGPWLAGAVGRAITRALEDHGHQEPGVRVSRSPPLRHNHNQQ